MSFLVGMRRKDLKKELRNRNKKKKTMMQDFMNRNHSSESEFESDSQAFMDNTSSEEEEVTIEDRIFEAILESNYEKLKQVGQSNQKFEFRQLLNTRDEYLRTFLFYAIYEGKNSEDHQFRKL